MPRPPRFIVPGLPQHVIVRGNNRDPIFASDEDYPAYLNWLFVRFQEAQLCNTCLCVNDKPHPSVGYPID
jgi:REP element-mobilizing transposase RayT